MLKEQIEEMLLSDRFYKTLVKASEMSDALETSFNLYENKGKLVLTRPALEEGDCCLTGEGRMGMIYDIKGAGFYRPMESLSVVSVHFHPIGFREIPSPSDLNYVIRGSRHSWRHIFGKGATLEGYFPLHGVGNGRNLFLYQVRDLETAYNGTRNFRSYFETEFGGDWWERLDEIDMGDLKELLRSLRFRVGEVDFSNQERYSSTMKQMFNVFQLGKKMLPEPENYFGGIDCVDGLLEDYIVIKTI